MNRRFIYIHEIDWTEKIGSQKWLESKSISGHPETETQNKAQKIKESE